EEIEKKVKDGGKFKDDFRITSWGKFLRKYWLDELPMLFNVLKGDLKLVGVRPLSKQYFDLYDEDLKEIRTRHKPGLVPPYYADLPKSLDEIMDSERRYLDSYDKHRFRTDIKYLYIALKNILFNKARSS
ncbi:MAG: sugar transferase, partial [Ignavibacteria bacterium]|nr:sugar transferase [Ignavibacteria bacterium]